MDSDNNELTDSSMIDTSTDVNSSHLCKVCGNPGAQMNYGAECCPPCKMFFRRNFQFDLVSEVLLVEDNFLFSVAY
jgi:hypothetical protein